MLYQMCHKRAADCLLSEYDVLERSKNRASEKERKRKQTVETKANKPGDDTLYFNPKASGALEFLTVSVAHMRA